MKQLAFLGLLAIAALVSSCGSNHMQKLPSNANWQAQLTGGTGPTASLNFLVNFNLSVTNGSFGQNANVDNFSFITPSQCFSGAPFVIASVNLINKLNTNQINGSFVLTVTSETGNVLTLSAIPPTGELIGTASSNGFVTNGVVNGQWWLTPGSGSSNSVCSAGSATSPLPFIMCQNATSCTTASGASILPSQF
jgi:hypothetical protein